MRIQSPPPPAETLIYTGPGWYATEHDGPDRLKTVWCAPASVWNRTAARQIASAQYVLVRLAFLSDLPFPTRYMTIIDKREFGRWVYIFKGHMSRDHDPVREFRTRGIAQLRISVILSLFLSAQAVQDPFVQKKTVRRLLLRALPGYVGRAELWLIADPASGSARGAVGYRVYKNGRVDRLER